MRQAMLKYLILIAGLLGVAVPTVAQDRLAIVIGNGAYPDAVLQEPAQNGIAVSQSLLGLGFDVIRLENANASDHPLGMRQADTVILYFSGNIAVAGGQTRLLSVGQQDAEPPLGWILDEVVAAYQKAGAKQVLVFLDTCHAGAGETANRQAPALDIPNVFQAQAAEPGTICPSENSPHADFTQTLLEALLTANTPLSEAIEGKDGIWFASTLATPFVMRRQSEPAKGLSAEDMEMLDRLSEDDRTRMLDLWRRAGIIEGASGTVERSNSAITITAVQNETIILTAAVQPVTISAAHVPVTNLLATGTAPQAQNTVRIFTAAATPARQFRPTATGLPTPSIIVGNLKPEDLFQNPTELGGAISGSELGIVDYQARRKMRTDDPALFEELLTSGAFDPPPEALTGTIQAELARMKCYSARVDGIWGNGSRAAVDRYAEQIGAAVPSREPVIELYHQLLRKDDAVCPVVRAATTTRQSTGGTTTARPRTPRAPAQTTPQTGGRTINRTLNPAGVFR